MPEAGPAASDRESPIVDIDSLAAVTARAEAGDARAMFDLGCVYDIPPKPGIEVDLPRARAWYEKSAALGFGWAQFALANMHERAEGGAPRNDLAARQLYESAARQGIAEAQMKLANMLRAGRGGTVSSAEAAQWYESAARQGHELAATNLALMHLDREVPQASLEKALELLEFAADKLDGLAHLVLGDLHLRGVDGRPHGGLALMHYCVATLLLPDGENAERAQSLKEALLAKQPALRESYESQARAFVEGRREAAPSPA